MLTTAKQRVARRLLDREGWERSCFVVWISWSQAGASVLVGSVMRKMIGMRPAWKRKYSMYQAPNLVQI